MTLLTVTTLPAMWKSNNNKLVKATQFAERNTINDMAFKTRHDGIENVRNQMTLRNRWTEGSIRVQMARRTTDAARVGSFQDYMADQEFGSTRTRKGKHGVPIPTAYASGEGQTSMPRKRLPRATNKLSRLKLRNTRLGGNKRQRNAIAVRQAVKTGRREIFMDTGRKQFIARVTGGKRQARVRVLYDLSRGSTPIPRNPWLLPATNTAVKQRERFYKKNMSLQMKRLRGVK